tara:strand:- start:29404 stop:29988 length:585 start_codon:yes stop_codon:yes gene_type:complete
MLSQKQKDLLKEKKQISILEKRESRYQYLGLLSEYQTNPPSLIRELEYTKLNPYQHFLFKRVLHGLNIYNKEEVDQMHWDKKRRIKKVWFKGQHAINELKQYAAYKKTQKIFQIFRGNIGEGIVNAPFEYLEDYKNKLTLKELGLKYEDLIIKFMSSGLLPKNFLSLKPNGNQESITKNGSNKQRVLKTKEAVS